MAKRPLPTVAPRWTLPRTALTALLPAMLVHVQAARADCTPAATSDADTIVCDGAINTPVDGGAGDDHITNNGAVNVAQTDTQASPPPLPDFHEFGSGKVDYAATADRTALRGGAGSDTIDNAGTSTASASATLQTITAPVTLAGGDVVSATNTVTATATGIAGDDGADGITSSGPVQADATAKLLNVNVEHNFADTSRGSVQTTIDADATGIAAAHAAGWSLTNQGQVTATATASSNSTNVEVNLADAAVADASLTVEASARALEAGTGRGTVANSGHLAVTARSESDDISVNMSYLDITLVDPKPAQGGTTLSATGVGIDGRDASGDLTLGNSAQIDVAADAQAHSLTIALASEGTPQGLKPLFEGLVDEKGIASIGVTAGSTAAGLAGGGGADALNNTGTVSVDANSRAYQNSINVGVSLIDWKIPTPGIVLGSAGTGATADAVGLDGGAGNDRIANGAVVAAGSHATAQAVTVSANISGFTDNPLGSGSIPLLGSLGASLALADTITKAQADAVGLRGNDGSDTLDNSGTIDSFAETHGNAISATASVNVKYKEGENLFSANAVGARAMTLAEATAIGIDGGLADYHQDTTDADQPAFTVDDDVIINSGHIDVDAETNVLTVAASIEVAGTVKAAGVTVNLAATDTSALGFATAVGVDAGRGRDDVSNTGELVASADADATAGSGSLQVGFAKQGAVVGAALARAEAVADARSAGIRGGDGDDTLTNRESIAARANADSKAIAVAVSVSATADGVSIAGSIADARGQALAAATGIDGGANDDVIRNDGVTDISHVTSSALAASISLDVSGTNNGVAAGIAVADSSAHATAHAIGLDGGVGDDRIANTGDITLSDVSAGTQAIGVAVALNAALNAGVAAGGAMTDTSAHSSTLATGIAGGAGNDVIQNTGTITASTGIGADASAISASLSGNLSMEGVALSAALSDSSSHAITQLAGIDGGSGDDMVDNRGAITLRGDADANGLAIAVSISAALGVGGGVAVVDGTSEAATTVTGIDGGDGRNDIRNTAHLDVGSTASAQALGISAGVELALGAGMSVADVEANSTATAIGVGDAGAPTPAGTPGRIANDGRIDVTADASVHGTAVSADLRGYSLGETSTHALADGYGMQTGACANTIDNAGLIAVTSTAEATGLSVAANLAGKAQGNADITAEARATGIATGGGDDVAQNSAAMNLTATSDADASAVSVTLAGTSRTDAKSTALTTVIAIDGGDGNDQLGSSGDLALQASSTTHANGLKVTVAGTTGGDVTNTPMSQAWAITGGAGNDVVTLGGAVVSIAADATADVSASSWNVAGVSGSRAGVDAQAAAMALGGGSGDDILLQRAGQLTIAATAHADADSVDWTFFGNTGTEAALVAQAHAVAIDGGAGADQLRNETAFTATAASTLNASGGGNTIFGNAGASTDVGASAVTVGLAAGDGNDRIENAAALTLGATATVNSDRAAFSFAGNPDINELLKASSTVVGLDGGSGDDIIMNTAAITATATASATTNGLAEAQLGGGSSASGKAVADADATGISGGSGADTIDNRGALAITASIAPRTNNSASAGTFFGDGHVEGRSFGTLAAAGIDAGDGDNRITNSAALSVTAATAADAVANTFANGSGFSFGVNGTANTYTASEIDATAAGIRAGNGANQVVNTGAIGVHLLNVARAYTDPNGGATSGSGNGDIDALVSGTGRGIELGDGNATVLNQGTLDVNVSPVARGDSDADGTASDSANSSIYASAFGEAGGIVAGDGNHQIRSDGAIHVTAAPVAMGYVDVDGGRTLGGATGSSNNYSTAKAYGIEVGSGTTRIENHALLSVTAAPDARPVGDRNVRAEGYGSGDANAYTYAQSVSEAVGIRTGVGSFTIVNTDAIEVSANSHASGGYYVSPGGLSSGHADSGTALYAEGRATGIWTGGTLDIRNSGSILVTALPSVNITYESGDGGPYHYRETWGTATGIDASHADGNQSVVNDGSIIARASASSFGENDGGSFDPTSRRIAGGAPTAVGVDLRGAGFKSVVNNGTIEATADLSTSYPGPDLFQAVFANAVSVGGDGARVVNNGTITARRSFFGLIGFNGYAVYLSGNGDTAVELGLGPHSVTNGNVALYGSRVTLELDGTPVLNGVFEVDARRDFDLVLDNAGGFDHALPTVANVTKNGAGVFNLPALNPVRTLTLNEGVLGLGAGYTFAPNGQMRVNIHGDGEWSGLRAAGTVRLDGSLSVLRDAALYVDGTRYRVIEANSVAADSAFDEIHLPDPTALVSFSAARTPNAFEVVAHVGSFESLAGLGNQRVMAQSLDALARQPSDAMRPQLAYMQALSGDELHQAFTSLSPVIHAFGTSAALDNFNQYDDALWQRLFDPALNANSATVSAAHGGRQLAGARDALRPDSGVWIRGFHRTGNRDAGVAITGYDYGQSGYALGYDRVVGNFVVGASLGKVEDLVTADGLAGRTRVNSRLYSAYGSYSHSGYYLDGIASWGSNDFDHERWIAIGSSTVAAAGFHEGKVFSAGVNGGRLFEAGRWVLGPYASLRYTGLHEDGFTESGGDFAAAIASRGTRSLVSTVGGRIGYRISHGPGEWLPELAVSWLHDHALDDPAVTGSFVGAPGTSFTVDGEPIARDGMQAGFGVSYRAAGFAARLAWRTELRGGASAGGLFGGLQYVY